MDEPAAQPSAGAGAGAGAAPAPQLPPTAFPPHFVVVDAALEALMLSRLPTHGAAGSKKRRREEMKGSKSCYEWANTGTCAFGEACRYSHDAVAKPETGHKGRETLRALAQEREVLFVTGGAGGGGAEGGGAGAGAAAAAASAAATAPAAASLLAATTSQERLVGPQVTPLSALARYYTRLYSPGTGTGASSPGWDTYVHLQANKCCVVGLASAHPLLLHASPLVSVAFAPALASGAQQLSGKRKKGAVWVEAETVLATATTADGRTWPLRAGMRGSLVECNLRLQAHPSLLAKRPATQGHLAIILTDLKRVLEVTRSLMCEGDYASLCASRGLPVG